MCTFPSTLAYDYAAAGRHIAFPVCGLQRVLGCSSSSSSSSNILVLPPAL